MCNPFSELLGYLEHIEKTREAFIDDILEVAPPGTIPREEIEGLCLNELRLYRLEVRLMRLEGCT